jgi:site-specific DNA-cytosine methylase
MKTFGTMFSGGELFGIGAAMAGLEPIWGIEKDDRIAKVARLNDFPVQTADVITVDFSAYRRPNHLHASPPCPNFSNAKMNAVETELDIAMAQSVCNALVYFKPDSFTLENVVGYRNSQSFKLISRCLSDLGYWWDATNLNAADFGVPQTRNRLWIRARRGLLMQYPQTEKWRGWYEVIEDIIPTLPDTEFAPWQIARLPEEYKTFMIGQGTYSPVVDRQEPAQTITANNNQSAIKAFIMSNGNNSFADAYAGNGVRYGEEPSHTMMANKTEGKIKAFVLDGQTNSDGQSITIRDGENPIFAISATGKKRPARAFIGRIVKMTVQALGRFQTVPDSYKGLTVRINGNGCPPLEVKKILESMQ